jgi:hypothetical protein
MLTQGYRMVAGGMASRRAALTVLIAALAAESVAVLAADSVAAAASVAVSVAVAAEAGG